MMFGDVEIKERPGDLKVQDGIIMDVKHLTRKGKFQDVSFQLRKERYYWNCRNAGGPAVQSCCAVYLAQTLTTAVKSWWIRKLLPKMPVPSE